MSRRYRCPVCHTMLDSMASFDGEFMPSPDDLAVCVHCLTICVWEEGETLRLANVEECADVPPVVRRQIADAQRERSQSKPS